MKHTRLSSIGISLRVLMISLWAMFVTGVAMVAIGRPTAAHQISAAGHNFWFLLFILHMVFLASVTLNALFILYKAVSGIRSARLRAIIGLVPIAIGSVSGSLGFQGFHASFFLFVVALCFLAIAAIYGPLIRRSS